MEEQQLMRSSQSHSALQIHSNNVSKTNVIGGLDLNYQERLDQTATQNTRNQKLLQMKNTHSQEQIASGECVRSSLYKLENTWLKRKTLEMGSAFLETPVDTNGDSSGQEAIQHIKKQKSGGKLSKVAKPAISNFSTSGKTVL